MKIFISQNMKNRTDKEILKERQDIIKKYNITEEEIIDSYITEDNLNAVEMLGKSIELLGKADMVFIPKGSRGKGVEIEYFIAKEYNIPIAFYF